MPKVSVIIPVYNTEKFLRKCLDSVCNQTLSDIEIICINDCSTDNSLEILKEYPVKIIDLAENKGAAYARNRGIEAAAGEYIGFVDSDDFIDLDFYEKLYNKAVETGADIVKSNLVFENYPDIKADSEYENLNQVRENKLFLNHIPTTLINRKFLSTNSIQFLEHITMAEDTIFETLISYYANKIEIEDKVYYHYKYNNLSLNNSDRYSFSKVRNMIAGLNHIIDFYNQADIEENIYKRMLEYRYNNITHLTCLKCTEIFENFEEFEKLILELKQKFKYNFEDKQWQNIELIKSFKRILNNKPQISKEEQIPKRIFYVWFGGKKTPLANVCIENWKEKLKGFEIIEINENSEYFDFQKEYNSCKWFKTVYDKKLWAFVSDYIRCKVLYDYGGIYLDTDVTIYKDLTPLLKHGFFLGLEAPSVVGTALIGSRKHHPLLAEMIDFYHNKIFQSPLYVINHILSQLLSNSTYEDLALYPIEFFFPFYGIGEFTPSCITPNTYTVHWWASSWIKEEITFFLENKHKIDLEKIDDAYKRFCRIKNIIKSAKKEEKPQLC